jgi:hypothetical protein
MITSDSLRRGVLAKKMERNRAYAPPFPSQYFSSSFGQNTVSIERHNQGASFGAISITIEEELNVFEGILSVKGGQPPR